MKNTITETTRLLLQGNLTKEEADKILLDLYSVSNSWLSPIDSEKEWQETNIKKIWEGYPNICPNWQIMNGLIRYSCENLDIKVTES